MAEMEKLTPVSDVPASMSVLDEMVRFKQDQIKRLQSELFAEQMNLSATKTQIEEEKKQARQANAHAQQEFEAGLRHQAETLQVERTALEHLQLELDARVKEVEVLEAQAEPTRQALLKLSDERIAVEQQRIRNEELRQENDRLATETSTLHEEVRQIKEKLSAELVKAQMQIVLQEQQQVALEQRETDLKVQLENLAALKDTIDPKLAEVTAAQGAAEVARTQAQLLRDETATLQAQVEKQRNDLAILSSQLEAKGNALTEYAATLKRSEAELRIKLQQAKAQGVETSPLPAAPEVT